MQDGLNTVSHAVIKAIVLCTMAFFYGVFPSVSSAHEYWIQPLKHKVPLGNKVLANLKNGENFQGVSLPRIPEDLVSVTHQWNNGKTEIAGRLGDFPALHLTPKQTGWQLITVQTKPKVLTYDDPKKYAAFIDTHGLADFSAKHSDLASDSVVVEEHYTRYAKTLLFVEPGTDSDATSVEPNLNENNDALLWSQQELQFEWVLTQLPENSGLLGLQLLFEGDPLIGRQAEVFSQVDGSIERSIYTTDGAGRIELAVAPNVQYLINAVKVDRKDPTLDLIHTDWATLTVQFQLE